MTTTVAERADYYKGQNRSAYWIAGSILHTLDKLTDQNNPEIVLEGLEIAYKEYKRVVE